VEFDPNIRYECIQCGKSCQRDWAIWVESALIDPVRARLHELRVLPEPFESVGERWRMGRDRRGCLCLDKDFLCQIHRHLGYEQKPHHCQQYPILLIQSPDGLRVSASYTCTAVLQEQGPQLDGYAGQVQQWMQGPAFVEPIDLKPDWPQVLELEQHLEGLVHELGWQAALERVLSALVSGFLEGRPDGPLTWWRAYRGLTLDLAALLPVILGALLKPCFVSRDPEVWSEFDAAMHEGGPLLLKEFQYQGSVAELLGWACSRVEDSGLFERYRRSLWFRRQHLRCGGILSGLLMLWSVQPLYRVLSRLCDSHGALERMELNLLAHSSAGSEVFPLLGRFLLAQHSG